MRTEILSLDGGTDSAKIGHAAEILGSGGLVAFPTETVYGIGADSRNPEALARLARVKGRLDGKNYSLLVGSLRQAEEVAGGLPLAAKKLARLYWPGLLTIVVPRASGGKVGLRLPEHSVARALLRECGFALAAPSAIKAGPGVAAGKLCDGLSAAQIRSAFDGQIALVLEGGAKPGGKLSTVVEVGDAGVNVQREGQIPELEVLQAAVPTVLFVCTGNTCRSPMAAGLFKAALARLEQTEGMAPPIRVLSAGTNATRGARAHPLAVAAMKEAGVDISEHRATLLTPDLIDQADWVFTMTGAQRESILEFMRSSAERVKLLSRNNDDIEEPGGRSLARYRYSRDIMARCLRDVLALVKNC